MTRRDLFFAVLITVAAVVKGRRLLWDAIDDGTQWLVSQADRLDLGWDVPDVVPAWMSEGER